MNTTADLSSDTASTIQTCYLRCPRCKALFKTQTYPTQTIFTCLYCNIPFARVMPATHPSKGALVPTTLTPAYRTALLKKPGYSLQYWMSSISTGLAGLILLLLPILFVYPEWIAQSTQYRKPFEQLAQFLDIRLPIYHNLQALQIEGHVLGADPNRPGYLKLYTKIYNSADFEQVAPNVQIQFSTLNSQPLSTQTAQLPQGVLLAPHQTAEFESTLEDPGEVAQNYQLALVD